MECIPQNVTRVECAVKRGNGVLLALYERVITPDGEGKVIWFTATGTAIVVMDEVDNFGHRLIRGYPINELQPV